MNRTTSLVIQGGLLGIAVFINAAALYMGIWNILIGQSLLVIPLMIAFTYGSANE